MFAEKVEMMEMCCAVLCCERERKGFRCFVMNAEFNREYIHSHCTGHRSRYPKV